MKKGTENRPSIVYLVTNKINGKRYIGATCQLLCQRRGSHFHAALKRNSQTYFHRSIRKYGRENFVFEFVAKFASLKEALAHEVNLIKEVNPEYNLTNGGDGSVGWKAPRELVERLAQARRGKPGPWSGKGQPPALREGARKWRQSKEGIESWKKNSRLGPIAGRKPIICLNDGRSFESVTAASKYYGIDVGFITSVCKRGRHKTAKGFVFRYAHEPHAGVAEVSRIKSEVLINRQKAAKIAREART